MTNTTTTIAGRRPTVTRHLHLQIELPVDATEDEENALVVQALVQQLERRGGVPRNSRRFGSVELLSPVAKSSAVPPSPRFCSTVRQFLARLRDLKTWSGHSFADLERLARERGLPSLPHTTVGRLLSPDNDERMPSRNQLTSVVLVCGLSVDRWREWAIAWEEVQPNPYISAKPWVLPDGNGGPARVVSLKPRKEPQHSELLMEARNMLIHVGDDDRARKPARPRVLKINSHGHGLPR